MFAEQGKFTDAIAEFERVLKVEPGHVQAHYNLGALYGDRGDFLKAAEHFARARASAPDDPQLALAFLNVAYRAKRGAEADAAADLVERVAASDPRGLFTLGTALAQNEQYERAARIFARVNEKMPRTFEVLYNLGVARYNLDRNDEALLALAEAADINPATAETLSFGANRQLPQRPSERRPKNSSTLQSANKRTRPIITCWTRIFSRRFLGRSD